MRGGDRRRRGGVGIRDRRQTRDHGGTRCIRFMDASPMSDVRRIRSIGLLIYDNPIRSREKIEILAILTATRTGIVPGLAPAGGRVLQCIVCFHVTADTLRRRAVRRIHQSSHTHTSVNVTHAFRSTRLSCLTNWHWHKALSHDTTRTRFHRHPHVRMRYGDTFHRRSPAAKPVDCYDITSSAHRTVA